MDKIVFDFSKEFGCLVIRLIFENRARKDWIDLCGGLPKRRYVGELKEWHVPFNNFFIAVNRFRIYEKYIEITDELKSVTSNEKLEDVLKEYENYVDVGLVIDWDEEEDLMTVSYRFDEEWLAVMRGIKGAYRNKKKNRWEIKPEDVYEANQKVNRKIESYKRKGKKLAYTKTKVFARRVEKNTRDFEGGKFKKEENYIHIDYIEDKDIVTFFINQSNEDWKRICKMVPGTYNPQTRCWEYGFVNYPLVKSAIYELDSTFRNKMKITNSKAFKNKAIKEKIRRNGESVKYGTGFVSQYIQPSGLFRNLYEFQKDGVRALMDGKLFLGDEQGLGKTTMLTSYCLHLKELENIKRVLVICPNSIKFTAWKNDVMEMSNATVAVVHGDREERVKAINSDAFFTVINYEAVRLHVDLKIKKTGSDEDKKKKKKEPIKYIRGDTDFPKYDVVVIDEAHRIKNPESQVTIAINRLITDRKIAASGTPIVNRPSDLAMAMFWLKSDFLGVKKYKNLSHMYNYFMYQYGEFEKIYAKGGKQVPKLIGYKNLTDLRNKYQSIAIRRKKSDVLKELPDKVYQVHEIELHNEQLVKYKDALMKAKLIIEDQEFNVDTVLAELTRCKQIVAGLEVLGGKPCSAKADFLVDLLPDFIYDEEDGEARKALIFTNFTEAIDKILYPRFKEYNPVIIAGSGEHKVIDAKKRARIIDQFQDDDECKLFIGSIEACQLGITLTAASTVIMYDLPWTASTYDQAVDRAHRIGQKNSVLVVDLIAVPTIEMQIRELILSKRQLADFLVDKKNVPLCEVQKIVSAISRDDIIRILKAA